MSDYEKINTKVKEQISARRIEAAKMIAIVMVVLVVTLGAFIGLNAIGFISSTFMVILASIAICTAAFKAGRISRDIKF